MNFNDFFLKSFRILLFPFALVYGLIIMLRNYLFDKKYLQSATFNLPLICVGNLAIGGTGKSPMVEYLVSLLQQEFKVAVLSRGYKRKTKGYALANQHSTALEIGDEPMQFHLKFPDIAVAVGEERIVAIPQLLQDRPDTEVVVLDDAFQHRSINAGLNILLTEYNNLFTQDFFLPTGDLRDQQSSYKRAQIIVVTKCPPDLSLEKKIEIVDEINPLPGQRVLFTCIKYGTPYHILNHSERNIRSSDEILLVCGIANPKPLKGYLADHAQTYYQQYYRDHHIFSIDDLKEIGKKFDQIQATDKFILTTEKDAVRFIKFKNQLENIPLYVLPIQPEFLFNDEVAFNEIILKFVSQFKFKPVV